mmetsp:Transcript_14878/g.26855  ORF Transcript_14878/g.26855 Transcript_14878/m.26855 type:complete len:81 (+) Transcript_14878:81-323(+)
MFMKVLPIGCTVRFSRTRGERRQRELCSCHCSIGPLHAHPIAIGIANGANEYALRQALCGVISQTEMLPTVASASMVDHT